ncbi:MAG: hypothetical protein PHI27_12255 [Eubacteriales bacterium]|nr:hypothetical protein [Eubacteriales bacterium]MDD3882997.1 hypothetical protein [Eubacteriales bacterium]MDD4513455.1 hypothetical protein [Eubacteriales bacterium]
MKKIIALILALCMALSLSSAALAEDSRGTIMWLSNLSSGIQFETTRDYLKALCDKMGYQFTIVYGDGYNDAAGNLTAVSNGMTSDVVGIIVSQDGGLASIMEQYPDVYVAGYNTDMTSVYGEGGANAAVLTKEHFLGTICDGFQDGANMGHQYFNAIVEKGYKRIAVINFPGYAYPNQISAVNAFTADLETYNAAAADDAKITLVGEPLTLEFQPLADSFFLEDGMDNLDCIVAFCAGLQFVYPTMQTAKVNGFCRADTQMITGGFDNNADIIADIGSAADGKSIGWICISPAEDPAYALVLLDNAISGSQFADFAVERVDSASYIIDSTEKINAAMTKGMVGSGDITLAQVSVDEVLQLCTRFNPDATFAGLKALFASEKVMSDALLK